MRNKYYAGRRWERFISPVEALTSVGFSQAFAVDAVYVAGDRDVVLAYGDQSGVRLVRNGDSWDRYYVRFRPLYDTDAQASREAGRMEVRAGVSSTATAFPWSGNPRTRPERI